MNTETQSDPVLPDASPVEAAPTELETPERISDQEMTKYFTGEYAYKEPRRGDLRTGVVIQVNESGLLVDCGFKREGLVPADDLNGLDEATRAGIRLGATVPVLVIQGQDSDGQPQLSIQEAQRLEDWINAEQLMASGDLYAGLVSGFNRGGLVVKFGEIRGFVPASQLVGMPRRIREDERRRRLEAMVGSEVGLKIIEVDRFRRRLIFSQRRALRAWQELKREQVMSQLAEADVRRGHVTDITNFGAFVDLGGADGLIHVSELSWRRVNNPREVLEVGQEVEVYVLSVDRERKRIALSLKKLQPDPWTQADGHYRVGQLVEGRVTRVLDFGAFIELDLGIEGLLHASEMIGTPELQPGEITKSGDTPLLKIIRIDSRRRRIALSAKQVRQNEWERWMAEKQVAKAAEEEEADEVPVIEKPTVEEAELPGVAEKMAAGSAAAEPSPKAEVSIEEPAVEAAAAFEVAEAAVDTSVVADASVVGEAPVEEPAVEAAAAFEAAEAAVDTSVVADTSVVSEAPVEAPAVEEAAAFEVAAAAAREEIAADTSAVAHPTVDRAGPGLEPAAEETAIPEADAPSP